MKSNYRKLGEFIREVDVRNHSGKEENLLGVSTQKYFIDSIANTVGTDFSNYKVVKKSQFTYVPDTSRRGDKVGIAMLEHCDEGLVSQAYTVFEIVNQEELQPEYLMMWYRRAEFDRYARFKSHGSVREVFDWDEMCNLELPVPSPDKQREIVREYKTIINRIKLNERLCRKLEETAQAIYKQWFVDFEFPNEVGKPYASNGGEMAYNHELKQEIPSAWELLSISKFCADMKSGGTPSRENVEFWNSEDVPWIKTGEINNNIVIGAEEYISQKGLKLSSAKLLPKDTVLMSMYGVNAGDLAILKFEATTNQACCGMICNNERDSAYLYYHLLHNQEFIASQSIGGAQENLNKNFIENIAILRPPPKVVERAGLCEIVKSKEICTRENALMQRMSKLLLSQMATIAN